MTAVLNGWWTSETGLSPYSVTKGPGFLIPRKPHPTACYLLISLFFCLLFGKSTNEMQDIFQVVVMGWEGVSNTQALIRMLAQALSAYLAVSPM